MTLDIERLRRDTPGCRDDLIHFNNAGAALMPRQVLDALTGHHELESRIGGYEAAQQKADDVNRSYHAVAALVNGRPDEIALLDSATRAWHAAFHAFDWHSGDVVLTARSEYNANMVSFLHARARHGLEVRIVPDLADGTIDPDALEATICSRTRLICLSHMPTNDGLINPVEQVGRIALTHGIPFLLDACQSTGQMPIDVRKIGCTMLSATGRKYLRGPRGTGFLWVDGGWSGKLLPHALDIRSASWSSVSSYQIEPGARRFELWEASVAGQIALGEAARYALATDVAAMWPRIKGLAETLRNQIEDLDGFTVHDQGSTRSGIVTFSHRTIEAAEIVAQLRSGRGINTSVSACQLTRTELVASGVTHMVRASVHAYNTHSELDALVDALDSMARRRGAGAPKSNNDKQALRNSSNGEVRCSTT